MGHFILIYIVQKVLTLPRGCNNGQILWRADAIIHSTQSSWIHLNTMLRIASSKILPSSLCLWITKKAFWDSKAPDRCNRKVNFEAMTHFWSQRMIKLPKNIETKKCTYIFFNLKSYVRQIYTFRHFLLYMYMQTKWGNVTLTFRSLGTSVTVQNLQNIGLSQ